MYKTIRIGKLPEGNLFAKIELEKGNLSISGVIGPMKNGNSRGSCGQIIIEFKEYDKRGYYTLDDISPAPQWTPEKIKKFFDVWDVWHLNDMQSACEHQRGLGWTYEEHHDPKTFKGEACPVCGYEIGSAWLKKELPVEVIEYLKTVPETDISPAWV
jgi:hypothetical protein